MLRHIWKEGEDRSWTQREYIISNAAHLISYTHATGRFGVGLFLFGLILHSESDVQELLWRLLFILYSVFLACCLGNGGRVGLCAVRIVLLASRLSAFTLLMIPCRRSKGMQASIGSLFDMT